MQTQHCPICGAEVAYSPRYPRYICRSCAARASSADGRLLGFGNEGVSGGFVAWYADTGENYPGHECFIDGIRCHANDAYLGGIVIQPVA
jgi:hypothetical protein